MKILFIVPYVPSLIRVRPYNLIKHLSERGNRVTVVSLWVDAQEQDDYNALKSFCELLDGAHIPRTQSLMNSLGALPTHKPLQAMYSWSEALAQKAVDLVCDAQGHDPYDVVHVEHLRGSQYGLFLKNSLSKRLGAASPIPVVWDSVDSISLLFRLASARSNNLLKRWLTRFELGRTERYESWLLRQFNRVLVTSELDKEALLALSYANQKPPSPIDVLPNGVDLDYFRASPNMVRDPATLIISGKMSYHANVTMTLNLVKKIMPYVWAKRPDVKLVIAGKDPPREIQALANNPAVVVTGTVKDLRPYFYQATAAVVPITYGVGIQNKVLEAMATATPVISTSQAVSALKIVPGEDVLVANEPADFAAEVLRLLADPALQKRVGESGRRYVEDFHHWNTIAGDLESIYGEAGSNRSKVVIPNLQKVGKIT